VSLSCEYVSEDRSKNIIVVTFFIVVFLAVTYNGLQLADVADLNAQNCQADTKTINSRNFQLPLHPQYSARCCYAQGELSPVAMLSPEMKRCPA
jgi:hypothetical protein